MVETNINSDFEQRKEPIVLAPGEVCKYVDICPYKQPNCYGASKNRN